ncbi:MAG: M81 family metallopeptidase [Bacteroidales bacterium]|nr:M81 family metallopeptidase [Bacteroidales bacterium]
MILISSCSPSENHKDLTDPQTILFAEFMHEVNSFSPVITTELNFMADHLYYGDDVIASAIKEDKQLAGFLEAVEKSGGGRVKTIPILQAKSMSGGPDRQLEIAV